MRASEIRTVELKGTENGIEEVIEITNWTDFGEETCKVYRLWLTESYYRDVHVTVGEVECPEA